MDIFIVPINLQRPDHPICGGGVYCFRVAAGGVIFAASPWEDSRKNSSKYKIALWGVPHLQAKILKGHSQIFMSENFDIMKIGRIDDWIQLTDQVMGRSFSLPRKYELLEAEPKVEYGQGIFLSAHHMDTVWIQSEKSPFFYAGESSFCIPAGNFHPTTHWATVKLPEDSLINGYHTPTMVRRNDFWDIFCAYQQFFMQVMAFNFSSQTSYFQRLQQDYKKMINAQEEQTLRLLTNTATSSNSDLKDISPALSITDSQRESLSQICSKIFAEWEIEFPSSLPWQTSDGPPSPIEALERMGFGIRRVDLQDWDYRKNIAGHLITNKKDDKGIVGFLPPHGDRKHYVYFDPQKGEERELIEEDIANSSLSALMVYPPLPRQIKNLKRFFGHILKGKRGELKAMLFIVIINTAFFICTPLLAGKMLTHYIPNQDWKTFTLALGGLCVAGFGGFLLYVTSSLIYISLSGHLSLYTQANLWKKIVALPANFFRRHPVGEILDRTNSINMASGLLNVSLVQYFSSFISGIIGLALLFYYDATFTLILLIMIGFIILIDYFLLKKAVLLEKRSHDIEFKINDFVLQAISAISKIRVARREQFILFHWAKHFCSKRNLLYRSRLLRGLYQIIHTHFIFYSNILLFFMVIHGQQEFPLEYYVIFNIVLTQFSFSMGQVSSMVSLALSAIPFITKIRPIVNAETPSPTHNIHPDTIRGRIKFSHVNFSYRNQQGHLTPILKDVSFTVEPGEYVAIVGTSGSGKSTIIRLLLGLEDLQSGSIHFDQYNLEEINLQSLREQIGAVLQSTQILPTSVIKNISMGAEQEKENSSKIYKQAWWSLRKASLEQDIIKMPMGMHTPLGQGECMSGGQRQRLLIARALNKNPRILLFDEATSAMDNVTQERIKKMLDNLNITRIIIAHRLSTITNVNRVIMLKDGQIVEQGSYQGLLKAGGEFARFAQQQIF